MKRRQILKYGAVGLAATSMSNSANALPEVGLPEVSNSCGPYSGEANPDEAFEVNGRWTSFTFDPNTHTYSNYFHNGNVSGNLLFTSVELEQHDFTEGGDVYRARRDVEIDADTFEARTRSRSENEDGDETRIRVRSDSLCCENSRLAHQLRSNNTITYWLASGYDTLMLDDNSVLIYRDDVEEPIAARFDGAGTQLFEANGTRIVFGGEGDVLFRVVTAADQVPEAPHCTPVLDDPCPE